MNGPAPWRPSVTSRTVCVGDEVAGRSVQGHAPVVNVHVTAEASGAPSDARTVVSSFAVYVAPGLSGTVGVSVETFVVPL